ncbi:hypothetical protein ANN_02547, partial [Periplaneta americana]
FVNSISDSNVRIELTTSVPHESRSHRLHGTLSDVARWREGRGCITSRDEFARASGAGREERALDFSGMPSLETGVTFESKQASRSSTRVCVRIRRPEFECSGPQLEGPEFECSEPQLEGPEFEYSELSLKVCGSRYCELEFVNSISDSNVRIELTTSVPHESRSHRLHGTLSDVARWREGRGCITSRDEFARASGAGREERALDFSGMPSLETGVTFESKQASRSSTRVCVRIRRPEFECSGPQLEGPEFECSEPQLEGPEFEYSELSLKVCGSRYCELENVINLVDKFRATECTERKKSVRWPTKVTEDAVEDARERMQRGRNKSVKKLAVEIGVYYGSDGSAHKILRNKLVQDYSQKYANQVNLDKDLDKQWCKFFNFNSFASTESLSELLKICQFYLFIPSHNGSAERVFSLISAQWTKERNRMLTETVRGIIMVKYNLKDMSCEEFHSYLLQDISWSLQALVHKVGSTVK